MVGFDQSILKNQELSKVCKNGEIFLTTGGHNADGVENEKLNLCEIDRFLKCNLDKIESIGRYEVNQYDMFVKFTCAPLETI